MKNNQNKLSHLSKVYYSPLAALNPVSYISDPLTAITHKIETNDGLSYTREPLPGKRIILTQDPDFIAYVFKNRAIYKDRSDLTSSLRKYLGNGVLFSKNKIWGHPKAINEPELPLEKIGNIHDNLIRTISDFLDNFPTGSAINITDQTFRLAFNVLLKGMFEDCLSSEKLERLGDEFNDLQDQLVLGKNNPFHRFYYKLTKSRKAIAKKSAYIKTVLGSIIKERRSSTHEHHDMLDLLMRSTYKDTGEKMTDEELLDEILVLLFSGYETVASTMSFALYLLSKSPVEAEKLKQSILENPIREAVNNPYMIAVLRETMRLFPPIWSTQHVSVKEDQFGKFSFPKGTVIVSFFYGLHRDPKHWEKPRMFQPERFLGKNYPRKAFYPYGAKAHVCNGHHFAMVEMVFFIHLFMERFEFISTDHHPQLRPLFTLKPDKIELTVKGKDVCII